MLRSREVRIFVDSSQIIQKGGIILIAWLMLTAIFAIVLPTRPASAAPFTCSVTTSFVSLSGNTTTQLTRQIFDQEGAPIFENIGSPATLQYNAIAYNQVDGFIYGIVRPNDTSGSQQLARIHSDGSVDVLGSISGLSGGDFFQSGTFDSNGIYWVSRSGLTTNVLFSVDISTLTATSIPLSGAIDPGDLIASNGFLWNITRDGRVVRIDAVTGTVLHISVPGLVNDTTNPWFALWSYGDGTFGALQANTNDLLRFRILNPASSDPLVERIAISTGALSVNGDGTSCVTTQEVDLGVTVSAPAEVEPNTPFAVEYVVTNHGPGSSSGYTFVENLPTEFSGYDTTTPGCFVNSLQLVCNADPLDFGDSRVIILTAVSGNAEICGTNAGTIYPNDVDVNLENNQAQTPTCVKLAASEGDDEDDSETPVSPSVPNAPDTGVGKNAIGYTASAIGLSLFVVAFAFAKHRGAGSRRM